MGSEKFSVRKFLAAICRRSGHHLKQLTKHSTIRQPLSSMDKMGRYENSTVRSDGRQTPIRFCELHGNNVLSQYLATSPPIVNVHKFCQ